MPTIDKKSRKALIEAENRSFDRLNDLSSIRERVISDPDLVDDLCLCAESENGICSECGQAVNWVDRIFRETDND